jgi:SAM-dependent methyltransferase
MKRGRRPPETAIVADGYDQIVERFAEWSAQVVDPVRDRLFEEFLASLLPAGRVLDLGCGAGIPWTRRLAERFRVTGVDISPRQIAAARRNVPGAELIVGDIAAIAFPPRTFDGAIAFYSIGHLPRSGQRAALERIGRWLRPGALLLASVPSEANDGWIGDWLGTTMFFASLGEAGYRAAIDSLGWTPIAIEPSEVIEPDGPARFTWLLLRAPGPTAPRGLSESGSGS